MKLYWSLAENGCAARQESDFTATFAVLMRKTREEWKLSQYPELSCHLYL